MQTIQLNDLVFSHFQSAFDAVAEERAIRILAGNWESNDNLCKLCIVLEKGSLFVSRYMINGTDVLQTVQPDGVSRMTALWWTGSNEFR